MGFLPSGGEACLQRDFGETVVVQHWRNGERVLLLPGFGNDLLLLREDVVSQLRLCVH